MHRRFLVLTVFLIGNTATAQEDLLACLDADVRAGLLFEPTISGAQLTRTVPEMLADMPQSNDLEFIGSSESEYITVAAYKTALAPGDAVEAASALLREADWRERELGRPPSGGFLTAAAPRVDLLCRDTTSLRIVGRAANDATYVRLQISENSGGLPCDSLPGGPERAVARIAAVSSLYAHLPTLVLPEGVSVMDPQSRLAAIPAGFSSDDRSMRTVIELQTDLPAQDLVEEFGRQLLEQGWTYDAGWSGTHSSGSGWTRSPSVDLELVGLLDLISVGDGGYRATFRASSRESG
ncbi:MAG: hypothetical protein OXI73_06640 [Rhodospirillales bacterium]|nr:hypothetical protein [Rhodospirillales bacterium]